MNDMTLQYTCPGFSIYQHEITMEHSTDRIIYVLVVYANRTYILHKYWNGKETTHTGLNADDFKLENFLI